MKQKKIKVEPKTILSTSYKCSRFGTRFVQHELVAKGYLLLFISQALDGFIAVITQDGQLFYVSENVRDFLGYSQVGYNFVLNISMPFSWANNSVITSSE